MCLSPCAEGEITACSVSVMPDYRLCLELSVRPASGTPYSPLAAGAANGSRTPSHTNAHGSSQPSDTDNRGVRVKIHFTS